MRSISLLLSLAACDIILPPPDLPPPSIACGTVGEMFGPCAAEAYTPDGCNAGLTCIEGSDGRICIPIGGTPTNEVHACAVGFGKLACDAAWNLCVIACPGGNDSECAGGTICDYQIAMCVWPGEGPDAPLPSQTDTSDPMNPTSTG